MKRIITVLIIIAVIVGGLLLVQKVRKPQPPPPTAQEIQKKEGIPVTTATILRGDIEETVEITGDIEALDTVMLSPKISGRITGVSAREGDRVSKGQVLVTLDQEDALSSLKSAKSALESARARLAIVKKPARSQDMIIAENGVASAKANLDNAEANYKRSKTLLDEGVISQATFDVAETQKIVAQRAYESAVAQLSMLKEGGREEDVAAAEAGVKQAQAAVDMAEQYLANTYIKSPISGEVSMRNAEIGQFAGPGQVLLSVVNLSSIYFRGDVSEKSLGAVNPEQPVTVNLDAFPDEPLSGKVYKIFPSGSTASRNFTVRISIDGGGRIKPGMFGSGHIVTGVSKDILLVPKDAIDVRKGTSSVFVVQPDNTVKRVVIEVLRENKEHVQIKTPTELRSGDTVVTEGRQSLQDGNKVQVKSAAE